MKMNFLKHFKATIYYNETITSELCKKYQSVCYKNGFIFQVIFKGKNLKFQRSGIRLLLLQRPPLPAPAGFHTSIIKVNDFQLTCIVDKLIL